MTSYDYIMTMKTVKTADLKAHLSEHLHYVRGGRSITVLSRNTPVARLVPPEREETTRIRQPLTHGRSLQDVVLPPPLALELDIVELLLEERQGER